MGSPRFGRGPDARRLLATLLIGATAAAACARPRGAMAVGAPPTAVGGDVGVRAIPDPDRTREPLPPDQEVVPPSGIPGNRLPAYPPEALREGWTPATEVVRIVIGVDGSVLTVSDSPLRGSTPGPHAARFRAAVEDAVQEWRFRPARWRRMVDGEDWDGDGVADYRKVVESREIPVYLDLAFTFRIVDGVGTVSFSDTL